MIRSHLIPTRLRLVAAALALGACHRATEPSQPLRGIFALRSVDNSPVPVLRYTDSFVKQYLTADTLNFDGRAQVTEAIVTRTDSTTSAYSASRTDRVTRSYAVRGDTVNFIFLCPPNALCVRPPVGWLQADGGLLVGDPSSTGYQFVRRYERVR